MQPFQTEKSIFLILLSNVIKRYKVKKALEQENLQLDLSYQVDEESVRKALETYCVALNREVVNYELTRENGEFKITNGARGVTLNEDGSVDKVTDYLEHVWKDGPGSVDLDVGGERSTTGRRHRQSGIRLRSGIDSRWAGSKRADSCRQAIWPDNARGSVCRSRLSG